MSLYFITGISGSGKSALANALKAGGYEAYDTDDDGFARWHNKKTGYIHPKSSVKKEDRTEDFLKDHSWIVPRSEVEELEERAKSKNIFLCGVASNEDEIRDLFKEVFELVIDEETLKNRLLTRTNNDWGKQPHEFQQTLERQQKAEILYRKFNPTLIDATQPVETVIANIIKKTKE
jgi:adenylate kinase family enzyme